MWITRRRILGASLGGFALGSLGCGDDAGGTGGGGGGATSGATTGGGDDLADVLYEGEATDEALVELLASTPVDDASQSASFLTPAAGATLDPATVQTFTWAVGGTALRIAPVPAGSSRSARAAKRDVSWLERAAGVIFDVREAHAHGAPVNGRAYLLVFSTASDAKLLRVFTTELQYVPDTAAWEKLSAAGAVSVTITNAIFEQNRVAPEGGPFVGPALQLGG